MRVELGLTVPFDAASVSLVRHVLTGLLSELDVDRERLFDLSLAVSEACTNVVDHTRVSQYDVSIVVDGVHCQVEVTDAGPGTVVQPVGLEQALCPDGNGPAAVGRGILLMRALVDRLDVRTRPGEGTVVHLETSLARPCRGTDC